MKRMLAGILLVPLLGNESDFTRCQKCEAKKIEAQKKHETIVQHIVNIFVQLLNIAFNLKSKDQATVLNSTVQIVQSFGEIGKANTRAPMSEQELLDLVLEIARIANLDEEKTAALCHEISQAYYDLSIISTNSLAH